MKQIARIIKKRSASTQNVAPQYEHSTVSPDAAVGDVLIDDSAVWDGLLWAMKAETTEAFDSRMSTVTNSLDRDGSRASMRA